MSGKVFNLNQKDTFQYAGGRIPVGKGIGPNRGKNERDTGQYEVVEDFDYMDDVCVLVSSKMVKEIGAYDEDLTGNYGYNDPLLRKQLEAIGVQEETLRDVYCQQFDADCLLERRGMKKNKKKMYSKIQKLPKKDIKILNFNWEKSF